MVSMMVINQAETLANSMMNSIKVEVAAGAMNNMKLSHAERSQSVKGTAADVMSAIASTNYSARG